MSPLEHEEERKQSLTQMLVNDSIKSPKWYKGKNNLEAIDVIEAFELDYHLGNIVKYVLRAGKKEKENPIRDLEKARQYLNRKINSLKGNSSWEEKGE